MDSRRVPLLTELATLENWVGLSPLLWMHFTQGFRDWIRSPLREHRDVQAHMSLRSRAGLHGIGTDSPRDQPIRTVRSSEGLRQRGVRGNLGLLVFP